jgi:ABC-type lipoprotein export system ATPase subunit
VAVVPQDLGLVEELTVAENVELPLWLAGWLQRGLPEAAGLLDRLGLTGNGGRLPAEVSLGERQRVALARAMVVRPRLLLADEPTGHQDADWATAVFDAVRDLAHRGSCCLVATHSDEFLSLADRVLTIADGELPAGSG